jgi:putative NADH-flavin reductase
MRSFIIGANGNTGTQLIDLALARGHDVTAFVRSPEKITRQHPRLSIVKGDPHSVDQLANALPGHDVVFSALGVHAREAFSPVTLLEDCVASTVAAMTRAGVARFVIVSAATLFPDKRLVFRFFQWLLKHQIRDLIATENIVRATDLEWTIARPGRLVHSRDEAYRAEAGKRPANAKLSMSFRAVAAFMLDAVEQHTFVREVAGLVSDQ